MNKRQKEVQQVFLDNEKEVLNKLKENYQDAIAEINSKIELLMARQDADMQHVIYQVEYQKMLKTQIQSILEQLQTNEFETVSEYLAKCYEDGFIGAIYDMQNQGVPLVMPIDQKQVVAAIQHETKLSEDLYTSLGKDVKVLQKKISGEISRGISSGQMYNEIARNVSNYAGITQNNAIRIARTEGHRIQCKATADAQWKAKSKGADVVKQWDSALDSKTRKSHRELDGQIRELEEEFEVNGHKAMYPGDFNIAKEDINCRCALLQRARWALEEEYPATKWAEDAPVLIDDDGTTQFVDISDAKNYKQFKERYQKSINKMATNSNSIKWGSKGKKITNEQFKELMQYARSKNIELSGFKHFDGDIESIKEMIDDAESVAKKYPQILEGRRRLTIKLDETMHNEDFAKTDGHIISINGNAYRNVEKLEEEYQKLVKDKWFVEGTDHHAIIKHELGHVVSNIYGIDSLAIAEEITGMKGAELQEYIESTLSEYASSYADGREIISECFASVYNSSASNEFALNFVEECAKIIEKEVR